MHLGVLFLWTMCNFQAMQLILFAFRLGVKEKSVKNSAGVASLVSFASNTQRAEQPCPFKFVPWRAPAVMDGSTTW